MAYCKQCGIQYKSSDAFCEKCGLRLTQERERWIIPKRKYFILGLVILAILLFVILPLSTLCNFQCNIKKNKNIALRQPVVLSVESTRGYKYTMDFSSDSGWETNDEENYYWDAGSQVFYSNNYTNSGSYATTPIKYDGGSFHLEFDIKVTSRNTGDVCVGLFERSRKSHQQGWENPKRESCFVLVGGYNPGAIYLEAKSATGSEVVSSPQEIPLETNTWYHSIIDYDTNTQKIIFTVEHDNTTLIHWTGEVAGGFSSDLINLGISMNGTWSTSGRWQTAYIDNIIFSTS